MDKVLRVAQASGAGHYAANATPVAPRHRAGGQAGGQGGERAKQAPAADASENVGVSCAARVAGRISVFTDSRGVFSFGSFFFVHYVRRNFF